MSSNVIYSTSISDNIRRTYSYWDSIPKRKFTAKNAAFLSFVNACEKENKHYSDVIDKLTEVKS